MSTDNQVAPLSSLAVTRMRRLLLQSSRVHSPQAHHVFTYSMFRGSGGIFVRVPGQHREILDIVQKAGELSQWISQLLAEEDIDAQAVLFQQIADRLVIFSYHLEDFGRAVGYDVTTGKGLQEVDDAVTENGIAIANSKSFNPTADDSNDFIVVYKSNLATGNDAAVCIPVLGAAIRPILDMLTSTEPTSASTPGAPTKLGLAIQLAASQACSWQPEIANRGIYANKQVPDAITATPNGMLMMEVGDVADSGSGLMQAISNDAGLKGFDFSKMFTGTAAVFPIVAFRNTFIGHKGASMWAMTTLAGLTDNAANMEKNFTTLLNNVESDINDVIKAAQELGQIITDLEQMVDVIASLVPEVIAVIAWLAVL